MGNALDGRPWNRSGDAVQRLEGKVALVTGAGSADGMIGVGVAIAVLFASQGAKVGLLDISEARAQTTRELIDSIGGDSFVTVGDITNPDQSARCVDEVAERYGHLDTLVNSAAVTGSGGTGNSPTGVEVADWDRTMATNVTGAVLMAKHAIPHIRDAGGGAIINVASIAGLRGMGTGAYAASKGALVALTADWAYAHGRDGIRVNCIAPGHIHTPMVSARDDFRDRRRRAGLLGTEGDAWDAAWAAVFLTSEEARWITGVILPVDAGTISAAPLAVELLNEHDPTTGASPWDSQSSRTAR